MQLNQIYKNSYSKLIERFKGKTRISNLMNSFFLNLKLDFPFNDLRDWKL